MISPLPLVVALGLSALTATAGFSGFTIIVLASLGTSVLLLVAILRRSGTEFEMEGSSSLGTLAIASALGLYLLGSYFSSFPIQWVSLLFMYNSVLLYLGGTRLVRLTFPPCLALVPLALPEYSILSLTAGAVLGGAAIWSLAVVVRTHPSVAQSECTYCRSYAEKHEAFCAHCGRKVGKFHVPIGGRKILKIVLIFWVLILVSFIPVNVLVNEGGVDHYSTYRIGGLQGSVPIGTADGWNTTSSSHTVKGTLTTDTYNLTNGAEKVTVVLALSPSEQVSKKAVFVPYPNLKQNRTVLVGASESATEYVSKSNSSVIGLFWSTELAYFTGTNVAMYTVSYLATQNHTGSLTNTTGIAAVAGLTLTQLQHVQQWAWLTTFVVGNWEAYSPYIASVGAVLLIFLPFEGARRIDLSKVKEFENTLGLSVEESKILAFLESKKIPVTGVDLVEAVGKSAGLSDWPSIQPRLVKLEGLGLARKKVVHEQGYTRCLWESSVG